MEKERQNMKYVINKRRVKTGETKRRVAGRWSSSLRKRVGSEMITDTGSGGGGGRAMIAAAIVSRLATSHELDAQTGDATKPAGI
jgi:hypothetical protein